MNPPRPPSDEEIDRLLASRIRDTTPAFEARWRDLRRELRHAPPPRRWRLAWPSAWMGLAATAGLAVLLFLYRPADAPPPVPPSGFSPVFAELLEMEDILGRATPLLDPENRDALLYLPVKPTPQT